MCSNARAEAAFEMTRLLRRSFGFVAIALIMMAAIAVDWPAAAGAAAASEEEPPEPGPADPAAVQEGHSIFNQTCAHCHGPNAVTGQSERNLRHLHLRYGDDMWKVFHTTVTHGRPDKGMPVWGEVLDERTIERIYGYLQSVQSQE